MAEQLKGTPSGSSAGQGAKAQAGAQSLRGATEQAIAGGRDIKDKVSDFAESSVESVKQQASDFAGAAKEFASQASDRIKERVADQAGMGADFVGNLAETIRRAAKEFDDELPMAANLIRKAASQVENVSETVRNGDVQDLIAGAQSFARRQPTAFLGLAVLAGFGAVRFLKSSTSASTGSTSTHHASTERNEFKGGRGHDRQPRPFDS